MARDLNRVTLFGHLGRDPEVRTFQNGDKVANLRIATSDKWRDKETGEEKQATEWHSVVLLGGVVKVAEQYLRKGARVLVEGRLRTRKWQDQSGADRYSTEIVVDMFSGHLQLVDFPADAEKQASGKGTSKYDAPPRDDAPGEGYGAYRPGGGRTDMGDEIPF